MHINRRGVNMSDSDDYGYLSSHKIEKSHSSPSKKSSSSRKPSKPSTSTSSSSRSSNTHNDSERSVGGRDEEKTEDDFFRGF